MKISNLSKDPGFLNSTEFEYFPDKPFFEDLDTDIIPPYWIVAGVVVLAGVVTIVEALLGLAAKVQTRNLNKNAPKRCF